MILLGTAPALGLDVMLNEQRNIAFGLKFPPDPPRRAVETWQARSDALPRNVAGQSGISYVPIVHAMCGGCCRTRAGETLIYSDDDHLGPAGALRFVAPLLSAQLVR